jgi:hypothetical protein
MDLRAIERALASSEAQSLLVEERVIRRVIKRHRHLPGIGLRVPHARCYTLTRADLAGIVSAEDIGRPFAGLPERVILLPRPAPDTAEDRVLVDLWRYAFHARVHAEIESQVAGGALTVARVRERVHRIGETEFDEIRAVLKQDGFLLPPGGDLETYAEFAALYLELSTFAPHLVPELFPAVVESAQVAAALAEDLDVERLLEASRPEGARRPATSEPLVEHDEGADEDHEAHAVPRAESSEADALRVLAGGARAKGNRTRSALLHARAGDLGEARADVADLAQRLDRAVAPAAPGTPGAGVDVAAWTGVLLALARRSTPGADLLRDVSARLVYDVQRACIASEKAIGTVDLVDWAASFGRKPLARLLPATRLIRVGRELARASAKVARVQLPDAQKARLGELCADARKRCDDALRVELGPVMVGVLRDVGFRPANAPERVALEKIVAELLDHAVTQGHVSLGLLRDAVSRNQLKMSDLGGPGELLGADALLAADRRLAAALDGVHRRGEIYVRALQKLSSLLFGTGPGRWLVMYVLLPIGGAYMVPFATQLVVTELAHIAHVWPHHRHMHLVPQPFDLARADQGEIALMVGTAALLFGLIHSAGVRAAVWGLLRAVGFVIATVFVHAPRWILARPLVQAVLRSRPVLAFFRYVARPAVPAALALLLTPLRTEPREVALGVAGAIFVTSSVLLNTQTGILLEETASDALARLTRLFTRHLLPGLFRLIAGVFRRFTDAIDRGIYKVDEWLRFREGQARWTLVAKATLGLVWFGIAYVLRIYVNLLLEPTFNPIKHVPTVTVAAKIMLPIDHELASAMVAMARPVVGASLATFAAGLTVVSLPGFFGFLVWELKENYKLYAATRAKTLGAVAIGHHGETMGALLKPGIHSGTVPKLWAKLRRAARNGDPALEEHRDAMREIEEAVERFVDRDLGALLAESARWQGAVHVSRVLIASNRVRVELGRGHRHAEPRGEDAGAAAGAGSAPDACAIAFEEQSGWLVACVAELGFAGTLEGAPRVLFENALAGLYHRAGVELVREQIEAALPAGATYDVADEGLVVWRAGRATEHVYDLDRKPLLEAQARGAPGSDPPGDPAPPIERSAILFAEHPIAWTAWVDAWSDAAGEPRRLVAGASLLPAAPTSAR